MSFVRNYELEKILKAWKTECHCKHTIQYWYDSVTGILTICTSEPGKLIGMHGCRIFKYESVLKDNIRNFKEVKFQEVNHHWI